MEYSLFKPDFPTYDNFKDYINNLEYWEEKEKFSVTLEKISSIVVPKNLFEKHFFNYYDLQTKSRALELSSRRRGGTNTVFGWTNELVRCKITKRSPLNIFSGLEEVYVSKTALPTFICTFTEKHGEWQWVCNYLGERHAFFMKNEQRRLLHFYDLGLKIDPYKVSISNLGCDKRELF